MSETTTKQTPIMQTRLDAAIKRLAKKVGQAEAAGSGVIFFECPTPKGATGTADRVRKELASGRLTGLPEGYAVKSRRNQVVIVVAANFHPWDRAAIAARREAQAEKSAARALPKAAAKQTARKAGQPKRRADGSAAARPRSRRRVSAAA